MLFIAFLSVFFKIDSEAKNLSSNYEFLIAEDTLQGSGINEIELEDKNSFINKEEDDEVTLKFYLGATFDMLDKKLDANSAFGDLFIDLPVIIKIFNLPIKMTLSASSGKSAASESPTTQKSPDNLNIYERSINKVVKFLNFSGKYYISLNKETYSQLNNSNNSEIYFLLNTEYRKVTTDATVKVKTVVNDSLGNEISNKTIENTNTINDDYFSFGPGLGLNFKTRILNLCLQTTVNRYFGSNENSVLNYLTQFKFRFNDPDILIGLELRGPLYTKERKIDSEVLFYLSKGIDLQSLFSGLFK